MFNTKVVGVTYENRQAIIAKLVNSDPVKIVAEPDNKFDPNALKVVVWSGGELHHIGYIPKDLCADVVEYCGGERAAVRIVDVKGGFVLANGQTAAYGVEIEISLPANDTDAPPSQEYGRYYDDPEYGDFGFGGELPF